MAGTVAACLTPSAVIEVGGGGAGCGFYVGCTHQESTPVSVDEVLERGVDRRGHIKLVRRPKAEALANLLDLAGTALAGGEDHGSGADLGIGRDLAAIVVVILDGFVTHEMGPAIVT